MTVGEGALNEPDFWQPGVFHSEHLVNMSHHNYREEPNVRFSPDKKLVIFTSNMFGPSYVFGVEVAKAVNPPAADVQSTPELARAVQPGRTPRRPILHVDVMLRFARVKCARLSCPRHREERSLHGYSFAGTISGWSSPACAINSLS